MLVSHVVISSCEYNKGMSDIFKETKLTRIELQIGNELVVVGEEHMPPPRKGQSFDELKKIIKKASQENLLKVNDPDY